MPHVELALGLYRDEGLLRFVLDGVRLPEGATRVAISLEDPVEGPFLVVTREGAFVTCLGKGMRPGDLPVVTRAQLDGRAVRASELRSRLEVARSVIDSEGGAGKLIRRVHSAGSGLCREDFVAASALQPLMERELLMTYFEAVLALEEAREKLMRLDKARPVMRPILQAYWNTLWAVGHLAVLALMNPRELFDAREIAEELPRNSLSWGPVSQGVIGVALRGFWGVAKAGKLAVGGCEARLERAQSPLQVLDAAGSLLVIAHRHSKLRAEIGKVVDAPSVRDAPKPEAVDAARQWATQGLLRSVYLASFETPEEITAAHRAAGATVVLGMTSRLPKSSPYRFERIEDVPDDLAFGVLASHRATFIDNPHHLMLTAVCLPWLARAKPEELYLPRGFLQAIHGGIWSPNETMRVVGALRRHYGYDQPQRAARPEGPARKGPCPCGSGEKYKRCCGAAGAS